jgi:hypothetical protein
MFLECETSGMIALLLSLDFKFANNFNKIGNVASVLNVPFYVLHSTHRISVSE